MSEQKHRRRPPMRGAVEGVLGLLLALLASWLPQAVGATPASSEAGPSGTTAGVAAAVDETGRARGRTVRYELTARLDATEHRIDGSGTIHFRNSSSVAIDELWLHLYLNAFKNDRTVFMREERAAGFRGGDTPTRWGWMQVRRLHARELDRDLWPDAELSPGDRADETDVRVPLPRALAPGEELTLEVSWVSSLPSLVHRTGFAGSFHMVAQWFPKLARLEPDGRWAHFTFHRLSEFYADFGDYDVRIDTPADFVVGATGEQLEASTEGDRVVRRFVAQRVHDFAFSAWDGFAERTAEGPGGVALRCLYPPGLEALAERELELASFGLAHYGDAYGPYPYPTLTIVHPPADARDAGGMEYPTLITTGGRWYAPLLGLRSVEGVTIHELGHQWFYGLLGSDEHRWPFLDEGLTSWATMRGMRERYGRGSGFSGFGWTLSRIAAVRAAAATVSGVDRVAQPAPQFASGRDYGRLVYARTATLLETLSRVYGGGRLEAAIGSYARKARFTHPGPEVLLAEVAAAIDEAAADNLRRGLFDRGWVDYQVASLASEPAAAPAGIFGDPQDPRPAPAKASSPHQGSVTVRRLGDLIFPVEIELWSEDGHIERRLWDGRGPHHTLRYGGESPLVAVVIDPAQRVLIDADLSNNVKRRSPARFAPRLLSRAAMVVQLLWGVLAP